MPEKTDPGIGGAAAEPSSANSMCPGCPELTNFSDGWEELVLTMSPGEHTGNGHGTALRETQVSTCLFSFLPPISQERETMALSYRG